MKTSLSGREEKGKGAPGYKVDLARSGDPQGRNQYEIQRLA